MRRKIAVVDYVGTKGGNHYYSLCLLDELAKLGYEAHILSNFSKGLADEDINFYPVYDPAINKSFAGLLNLVVGTFRAAFYLKKRGIKTVLFHLFESSWVAFAVLTILKLAGIKILGISHDVTSFEKNENQKLPNLIYYRLLDNVIVHNHYSLGQLKSKLGDKIENKTQLIRHGGHEKVIDANIGKIEARKLLGLDQDTCYGLFFGQIKIVKGLDLLLEAFPNDSSSELIIAGKPWKDDFNLYQEIIDKRGINDLTHQYIRYITEEERDCFYQAADFIILPYREIFQSGVLLMAMSYGTPIIASDLPANKEVLEDDEGLFFESDNKESLEKAIQTFCKDPEMRIEMSRNASVKIKSAYSWAEIAKQYPELIE